MLTSRDSSVSHVTGNSFNDFQEDVILDVSLHVRKKEFNLLFQKMQSNSFSDFIESIKVTVLGFQEDKFLFSFKELSFLLVSNSVPFSYMTKVIFKDNLFIYR